MLELLNYFNGLLSSDKKDEVLCRSNSFVSLKIDLSADLKHN